MSRFQKISLFALISMLLLMVMGSVVRVSGAGMGCPDWPTCWGCLIPPTHIEQVDFQKLPIERFQKRAVRMGRSADEITEATLRKEFNPRHVWTEFLNRLCTMPVAGFTLAMFIASYSLRKCRPSVFWASFASVVLVLANAILGAMIVFSGLHPQVITLHLIMAMLLIGLYVYNLWYGAESKWRINFSSKPAHKRVRLFVSALLVLVVIEGLLGTQVREITDTLQKNHAAEARSSWIGLLEQTMIYLVHRSFSRLIFICTWLGFYFSKKHRSGGIGKIEASVFSLVVAQMVLGLVMSQFHIYAWVQVLHVSFAAIMLALVWLWLFGLSIDSKEK